MQGQLHSVDLPTVSTRVVDLVRRLRLADIGVLPASDHDGTIEPILRLGRRSAAPVAAPTMPLF